MSTSMQSGGFEPASFDLLIVGTRCTYYSTGDAFTSHPVFCIPLLALLGPMFNPF